jgi:hypothetical protein
VIRTVAWKECREQATVWVAVAALAVLALVGVRFGFADHGTPDEGMALVLVAVGLAVTYGLVCGAMMLAGEVEGGTLAFLDTLPAPRRQVWGAKFLAGLLLALFQGLLLGVAVTVLGVAGPGNWSALQSPPPDAWVWLGVLSAVTVEAYCWGLLGSALCRHVLPAVIVGALFLVVPWVIALPPAWREETPPLVIRLGMAAAALVMSALLFTRPDRERTAVVRSTARPADNELSGSSPSKVLLWLAARQGSAWLLVLAGGAFLLALVLAGCGPIYWPVLSLLVGVACGSTVFLGEQAQGTYRFLGEQRVPLGRLWLGKTGFWLAAAVAVGLLVLLGGVIHLGLVLMPGAGPSATDGGSWALLAGGIHWARLLSPGTLFGLWLLYGFSIALTCTLAWRNSAAALFMSLVLSAAAGAVWVPSLLAGGLPAWQVFAPPVALLAVSRLLLRPWVSDRLYTTKPLAALTLTGVLTVAWVVACLAGRVASVSDLEEPAEAATFTQAVHTFVERLRKPEQNESASLIRQALARLKAEEADTDQAPHAGVRPQAGAATRHGNHGDQVERVLSEGWTDRDNELGSWLDQLFPGAGFRGAGRRHEQPGDPPPSDWAVLLREGAAGPLGMIEDPRRTEWRRYPDLPGQCQWAGSLYTARALQLQDRGDDRAALAHLVTVLGLSRQLRSGGTSLAWQAGVAVEQTALTGLDHWLERVGPRPELLREALAELSRHEQALPEAPDAVLADYLSCREMLDNPSVLLELCGYEDRSPPQRLNAALLTTAWEAPWEKARVDLLVASVFAGRLRGVETGYALMEAQRPPESWPRGPGEMALEAWRAAGGGPAGTEQKQRLARLLDNSWVGQLLAPGWSVPLLQATSLCRVRGHRVVLALLLYEAEKHEPAPTLDALTAGGPLAELPHDPFSPTQQGFSYRVSEGEDIAWDARGEPGGDLRHIKPGQGVVWSVGPDLINDGGHAQAANLSPSAQRTAGKGRDWIFLVPSPP